MGWPRMANHTSSTTMAMPSSALSGCWPRKTSGAPVTRPCSLAKATIEPVKVMAPITVPRPISIRLCTLILPGDADAEGVGRDERRRRDEHRRQADQRVEGGHELRQRRHLDAQATTAPIAPPIDQAADDQPGRDDARRRHGDADRDHHADDAVEVAGARRHGRAQPAQRHDEADGGDQIAVGGEFLGDHPCRPAAYFLTGCFFLNIDSMRCVTMKPPKMLTAASATAMAPKSCAAPRPLGRPPAARRR